MKIVDIAVKKVYRFNCPNCQSRLEADSSELTDIGGKVSKFYCPGFNLCNSICCSIRRHLDVAYCTCCTRH